MNSQDNLFNSYYEEAPVTPLLDAALIRYSEELTKKIDVELLKIYCGKRCVLCKANVWDHDAYCFGSHPFFKSNLEYLEWEYGRRDHKA